MSEIFNILNGKLNDYELLFSSEEENINFEILSNTNWKYLNLPNCTNITDKDIKN